MNATGPKILVVDDSATIRRGVINVLNETGYADVSEAADGREALLKLKEHPYDLVITDWNMPKIDGVALTCIMRQSEGYNAIPILMITSRSVEEDIMKAVAAGVNGYVIKPFAPETLRKKIDRILSGV